jgi:hypothetical protein
VDGSISDSFFLGDAPSGYVVIFSCFFPYQVTLWWDIYLSLLFLQVMKAKKKGSFP